MQPDSPFAWAQVNPNSSSESMRRAGQQGRCIYYVKIFTGILTCSFVSHQVNPNSYYESMGRAGQRGGERERQLATFSRNAVVAAEVRFSMAKRPLCNLSKPLYHWQAQKTSDVSCLGPEAGIIILQLKGKRHSLCVLSHQIPRPQTEATCLRASIGFASGCQDWSKLVRACMPACRSLLYFHLAGSLSLLCRQN